MNTTWKVTAKSAQAATAQNAAGQKVMIGNPGLKSEKLYCSKSLSHREWLEGESFLRAAVGLPAKEQPVFA